MATVTPVKTDSVEVLAHQAVTHPTTVVGSAIDCRTKRAVLLFLFHAYVEATADKLFSPPRSATCCNAANETSSARVQACSIKSSFEAKWR